MFGSKSRSMGREKLKSEVMSNFCSWAALAHDDSCDQSGWVEESKEDESPF